MRLITRLGILLFTATIVLSAFYEKKCDHVFTAVVQPAIKIKQPSALLGGQGYQEYSALTGMQDGPELICVKCFHRQKQAVDYGAPVSFLYGTTLDVSACCPFPRDSITKNIDRQGAKLQCDTLTIEYGVNELNHLPVKVYKIILDTIKK